ncbi:hypothetical protein [Kribbella sp. CA-247076]|uniref:hypothetical protein n=1 Tax=Kribbella sp. CA-247076 TaxID=3239941 RepID=UPI003D8A9CA1
MTGYWLPLLVLVALAVTLWTLHRRRRTTSGPSPSTGSSRLSTPAPDLPLAHVIGIDLSSWTDAQLYAVWRATADELRLAARSGDAATAARARDLLLTELERRHPRQTATWLTSPEALTGQAPTFLLPKKQDP